MIKYAQNSSLIELKKKNTKSKDVLRNFLTLSTLKILTADWVQNGGSKKKREFWARTLGWIFEDTYIYTYKNMHYVHTYM